MTFGERLILVRKKKNLSQSEVGKKLISMAMLLEGMNGMK